MKADYEWSALKRLLEKSNTGKKTVTEKEIEEMIDDESDSPFETTKPAEILKDLEEKKFICKRDENVYDIIADVAVLRKAIIEFAERKTGEEIKPEQAPMKLSALLNAEWVAVDSAREEEETNSLCAELGSEDECGGEEEEEDDCEDDEDDGDNELLLLRRRAYLEARRQELIERMRRDMGNDADEDAAEGDGENAQPDDGKEEAQADEDDLSGSILCSIREGAEVEKSDETYVVSVPQLDLCDTDAKFELFPRDGKVYLCDQRATFSRLEETVGLNDEVRSQAERIAKESGAEIIDEKLCVEVLSADRTLPCLFRLYALTERVLHIGDVLSREAEKQKVVPEEYIRALEYVVKSKKANIIDLHAEFRFGPNMIGLILEWMEKEGFITPFNYSEGGRKVLLTLDEFKRRFGKK